MNPRCALPSLGFPLLSFPHNFIHLQQASPTQLLSALFFRRLSRRFGREEGELMSDRPALTDRPGGAGPSHAPPSIALPHAALLVDLLCQTFALS